MKHFNLIDKAFLLKRTLPFSALDLDLLLTIADKLGHIKVEAGDPVFVAGEEAGRLYFLIAGSVELRSPDGQTSCRVSPGDYFGEESLFSSKTRGYSALATSSCDLLTLSRTALYSIISECPSVAVGFLECFATLLPLRPHTSDEGES